MLSSQARVIDLVFVTVLFRIIYNNGDDPVSV